MVRASFIFAVVAGFLLSGSALGIGNPDVAALQVGLRAHGVYGGTIDGIRGPATDAGVRRLQRQAGLRADGVVGPRTRTALGRYGRPPLGNRPLARGAIGWDVAALQFLLAWHGFPSGTFDGHFGAHVDAAVLRFQRWAGLVRDGVAGPATIAALRSPPPRSPVYFSWPVVARVSDRFGPRGNRFHPGLDLAAGAGTPVAAGRAGRVVYAGWTAAGWGNLVRIYHGRGVTSMYAHLSRIGVGVGERVAAGTRIGRVGSTGFSTGPHLHFEVRVRGAAVDPLPALP